MSHSARIRRRRRSGGGASRWFLLGFLLLLLCGVGVAAAAAGWVIRTANEGPALSTYTQRDPGGLTEVLASDGTRLGFIQNDDLVETAAAKDFPEVLKQATVAIEDERFYKHTGVDYEGIIRAAVKNATVRQDRAGRLDADDAARAQPVHAGRHARRASRATSARSVRRGWPRSSRRSTPRSGCSASTSTRVPYGTYGGQTAIGAGAAARLYFDKPVKDLTLREAAMLAGMPQAPSQYSPVDNPSGTTRRAATRSWARWPSSATSRRAKARSEMKKGLGLHMDGLLLAGPRALRARLRQVRADQGVRPATTVRRGGFTRLHDDQPQVPAVRARRDEPSSPASARRRRSSRSTPRTATSWRWPRRRRTGARRASRRSTSPPRASASPARRSRSMALLTALREGVNPSSTTLHVSSRR